MEKKEKVKKKEKSNSRSSIFLYLDVIVVTYMVVNFFITATRFEKPDSLNSSLQLLRMLLLFCYLLISFNVIPKFISKIKITRDTLKFIIFIFLFVFTIGITLVTQIYAHAQGNYMVKYHDGAYQNEIAFSYILEGKNPYEETYYDTELDRHHGTIYHNEVAFFNPALEHYVYMPGMFLFVGGLEGLIYEITNLMDVRLILLLMFLGLFVLMWKIRVHQSITLSLIALFAFSSHNFLFLLEGRTDIILIFLIVFSVYFFSKNRYISAGLIIGLALALKQVVAPVFLFCVLFLLATSENRYVLKKIILRFIIPALGVPVVVSLPFLFLNFRAFLDDVLLFGMGIASTGLRYPVTGFSIKTITFFDNNSWVTSLLLVVILVILSINFYKKTLARPQPSRILLYSALMIFFIFYFASYFNDSHLLFVVFLMIFWYVFYLYELNQNYEDS